MKLLKYIGISLVSLSLCACGGNTKGSEAYEEPVKITFSWWGTDTRHEATMAVVKLFEEKYPYIDVKVEFSEWTGFDKKMDIYIAGNSEPDLMQLNYNWLEKYSKDGTGFYDLNQLSEVIDLSAFSESTLEYGERDNTLNGIPISMNGKLLMYNANTFEKFKATAPNTWEELIALGEKFSDPEYYPLDLDRNTAWFLCCSYAEQKSGRSFINEDGSLGFTVEDLGVIYDFYKELESKKVIHPLNKKVKEGLEKGYYGGTYKWLTAIEKTKKSMSKYEETEILLGKPLVLEGASSSGWNVKPSSLLAVSKNTEHPKEAGMLLNFILNDPEAIQILGTERGVPVSEIAIETLGDEIKAQDLEALDLMDSIEPVLINPYMENETVEAVYEEAMTQLGYGDIDKETWTKQTYSQLVQILAQVVK